MQLDEFKTFVTLADVKNFTKTAEMLSMSQPTVSLHIKNLEKEFGTELFRRSPKFLHITTSGELLLERAKEIIGIVERTKQEILEQSQTIKGVLKIGASYTIGEYLLPLLLRELKDQYTELEFDVLIGNTYEIVKAIQASSIDIGLIVGEYEDKEIRSVPFMEEHLCIVSTTNHTLTANGMTINELQEQSWIMREEGSGTRAILMEFFQSHGLRARSTLTIGSNQGIKEAVKNGLGLSLLPQQLVNNDENLQELKINESLISVFSYIYNPINAEQKNVKAFIKILEEV
ncbi:LysR family transcriptional regulator [Robertmurraya kyonggiensis]|uniref:LysR family transcriptional regulator n=1 Tax=Robertmurraya kyonggiensis TaxID=1037680 RepID=A0A4U1D9F6_9BACI|nr:LysR family transcriptional regulator [Robertmurraya kyonggiensis]TKC19179.1 LysR family transcriptional regulator [Robertmurraya kyonggiensis]